MPLLLPESRLETITVALSGVITKCLGNFPSVGIRSIRFSLPPYSTLRISSLLAKF